MRNFKNILYVSNGISGDIEGLKQAISLARNNQARLCVLMLFPGFPQNLADYRASYEELLQTQIHDAIRSVSESLELASGSVNISIELASDDNPSVRIIRQVLGNDHDLLIKEVETHDGTKGFKALDMALLRKCPCPVWLCRPIAHARESIQVAVAIDPKAEEAAAEALSKRLLQLSRSLADSCSGELHIVSCWDYEYEEFLLNNPWAKQSRESVSAAIAETAREHENALKDVISRSGIAGKQRLHHLRGRPDILIPSFVVDRKIDILVMGTVARTGIEGFMIGNTAENIVQQLNCSLMALKPPGFVCPVKLYD